MYNFLMAQQTVLSNIIQQLERQHGAIQTALVSLRELDEPASVAPTRRKYQRRARPDAVAATPQTPAFPAPTKRAPLTPEGRDRLSKAMKKRWKIARRAGGPLPGQLG